MLMMVVLLRKMVLLLLLLNVKITRLLLLLLLLSKRACERNSLVRARTSLPSSDSISPHDSHISGSTADVPGILARV